MTITIRQAKTEDARCIVEAEQAIAQEPGYFCSQPSELSEQNVKQTIESSHGVYLVAEKEVTITRPDNKDDSFQNKPSEIFTMYKKGFKTRLIEEKPDSWLIDLYPEEPDSDLTRVRLTIGKTLTDLKRMEYKRNDGVVLTILVKEYNLKFKPEQETFIFNPEKYKGVEIIDMR